MLYMDNKIFLITYPNKTSHMGNNSDEERKRHDKAMEQLETSQAAMQQTTHQ